MHALPHVLGDILKGRDPQPVCFRFDVTEIVSQLRARLRFPTDTIHTMKDQHQPYVVLRGSLVDP